MRVLDSLSLKISTNYDSRHGMFEKRKVSDILSSVNGLEAKALPQGTGLCLGPWCESHDFHKEIV